MTKKFSLLSLFFLVLLFFGSLSAAKAQEETPPAAPNQNFGKPPRPNLFKELGLTPEQRQQIKRLNMERKPQMRQAQERLREANRNLDQAIYADNVNESEIQARLKDVQSAHAEIIKIRSMTELAIRRILTAEQLQKFREVRQQFAENLKNRFNRSPDSSTDAPPRNFSSPRPPRRDN